VAFEAGIISPKFYTTLVLAAVLTSQMAGAWLDYAPEDADCRPPNRRVCRQLRSGRAGQNLHHGTQPWRTA